jgi:hypothetical protein
MPYLSVNTPLKIQVEAKEQLARELIAAYSEIMQTQLGRPNVGIIEMGDGNVVHLAGDALEPIMMVMVEYQSWSTPRASPATC